MICLLSLKASAGTNRAFRIHYETKCDFMMFSFWTTKKTAKTELDKQKESESEDNISSDENIEEEDEHKQSESDESMEKGNQQKERESEENMSSDIEEEDEHKKSESDESMEEAEQGRTESNDDTDVDPQDAVLNESLLVKYPDVEVHENLTDFQEDPPLLRNYAFEVNIK